MFLIAVDFNTSPLICAFLFKLFRWFRWIRSTLLVVFAVRTVVSTSEITEKLGT